MTAAGRDGERLVTDEMVERWAMAYHGHPAVLSGQISKDRARAALAAVAADLDRGGYDRARRDCAAEIRRELVCCGILDTGRPDEAGSHSICYWGEAAARIALASSGRAPADEEQP